MENGSPFSVPPLVAGMVTSLGCIKKERDENSNIVDSHGAMKKNGQKRSLLELTAHLARTRSNQPRVTLQEARAQANRVMKAAKRSPLRLKHSLNGEQQAA